MRNGWSLLTIFVEMLVIPQVHPRRWTNTTSTAIFNVMWRADALLLLKACADSCDAGMTYMDACITYIMPFVVRRVTWESWPYKQGRPPISWGGCRRECRPIGGCKRDCWQAGVLTKVCRSMFTAVTQYAACEKPTRKQPIGILERRCSQ